MDSHWTEIEDHTADCGIEVYAENFIELVLEASIAFAELTTNIDDISAKERHHIIVEGEDFDLILVEFLQELLYLLDTEHFIAVGFKHPQLVPNNGSYVFSAKALGDTFIVGKHESRMEIKAVTYHQLEAKKLNPGWYAKVIFDI